MDGGGSKELRCFGMPQHRSQNDTRMYSFGECTALELPIKMKNVRNFPLIGKEGSDLVAI